MGAQMISIIIPVYNVEKYLRECLDSILNQTYQDFEVICIDDGSTDKSLEILEEYAKKDSRFSILKQNHKGAGSARNKGIETAQGKYVQFLDSDDYFEPDMLEKLLNTAEKYQADLTVCSAGKVDRKGNITESGNPIWPLNLDKVPLNKPFHPEEFPDDIFSLFCVVPWNKLYLKELITKNNLKFQNIPSSNDVGFSHIARVCAKRIVVIEKELINYRHKREGSIAEKRSNIDIISAAVFVKEFLKEQNLYEKYKNSYIKAFINHIRSGIACCNRDECIEFAKALKLKMPEEYKLFRGAFSKCYVTANYLKRFIGNKKVILWGASVFIRQILENENEKNPNILGFVDKNKSLQGKYCGRYKIYPPESINELKPDGVILTVLSNNEDIYKSMQKEFAELYPDVKLLPNILNETVVCDKIFRDNDDNEIKKYISEKENLGFEFIYSKPPEINVLERLNGKYEEYSEMSNQDRLFLSTLVTRFKPQRLLELGVSRGGSSIIMLNAIKDLEHSHLYSIDYFDEHYKIKGKKTGFGVDDFPELKKKWTLKTGGMALNFLDELSDGKKFDFCFIDTVHSVPGEILDFLQVLPFLAENAVVVFHDTNSQLGAMYNRERIKLFSNNILMSAICGKKLIPAYYPYISRYGNCFNNIGAVKLERVNIYSIFNLLALPWTYLPSCEDLTKLKNFYSLYYNDYYIKYFEDVIFIQKFINLENRCYTDD